MSYDGTDRRMSSANESLYLPTSLLLRKLPLNTTPEAVRTMLLFAKDLQEADIVSNDRGDDQNFATAVARFSTMTGATEAQAMLDGKPNTEGNATMIVEITSSHALSGGLRRNTMDPALSRQNSLAISSPGRSSRYHFDSMNRLPQSPAVPSPEIPLADGGGMFPARLQQPSPRNAQLQDRTRVSGKSVISDEGGDEETDGLLRDPVGYMRKGSTLSGSRRGSGYRPLVREFDNLSLNTNMARTGPGSFGGPRSAVTHGQSPRTPFSPGGTPFMQSNPYIRHNYPPVNPADQNPPCNTLYVGNLPMDTSEDELKAMFSKQRGFKRLCFRTKQNGPMCFVEFEDVSFATKALSELYGAQLHNSVKGGIRLSFSKNPLGVRSGQLGGGTGPATPLHPSSSAYANGMPKMSPVGLSIANGPPPGLSSPGGYPGNSNNLNNGCVGLGMRNAPSASGSEGGTGVYPDYMMGR
ncbi:cell cycle RNA binding protein whi3 [Lithohypha guttulata]|uniref:Cell cycle RNA binding protein whi3 n=1 Tax=Lithohypha guttulata TaxID=1690604 RepID=A0AAN7TAC4_9EURO|nr:cell cycle RNA binding protein whi3 [Lithohypha guttulata]